MDEVRLIDADKLVEDLCSLTMTVTGLRAGKSFLIECLTKYKRGVLQIIHEAPTIDAVEVVRCKDCKYSFRNNGHDKEGCPIWDHRVWMDDNDFCSHGERRKENAAD